MEQTAVEFIVDELNKEMGLISFVTGIEESYKSAILSIIQQAKEMEKEQIQDAYNKGEFNQGCNGDSEQYYNETFKSE